MSLIKHSGQVFTPDYLVVTMLDFCGYCGRSVLNKHLIDNSCGDGAFLCEAAGRYCSAFLEHSTDLGQLKRELECYIHGIECDITAFNNCVYNLNAVATNYSVRDVNWDILNQDALCVDQYNHKIDFVVGNPPYVRVHNLDDQYSRVKSFAFANAGMTDLFLAFFEIGFKMVAPQGKLCYITPSSWLNSNAAEKMRSYVHYYGLLSAVIDLEHFQPFERVTTYTLISLFENGRKSESFDYYVFDPTTLAQHFVDTLSFESSFIDSSIILANNEKLDQIRKIKSYRTGNCVKVKNGFATLADDVFIGDLPFSSFTIPILKASTGRWSRCLFPYDSNGKPLSESTIFQQKDVGCYLNDHRQKLLKGRNCEQNPQWYLFGRTQALKDVAVQKYAINTIVKDRESIKLNTVPAGSGVYSGLYILTDLSFETIRDIVVSDDFIDYVKTLKCYKSGGYYTYGSKDLEQYLNYRVAELNQVHNNFFKQYDKRSVSQSTLPFF